MSIADFYGSIRYMNACHAAEAEAQRRMLGGQ
jgi:hypothetical protein